MNGTAFRALVRKDLRVTLSDRRAFTLSFLAPIAIASFMAMVLGVEPGEGGGTIDVRVSDQDDGPLSKQIVANLGAEKSLKVGSSDPDAAREAVRKGEAALAVVIPRGFGDAAARSFFRASGKPTLEVLRDPSHTAEAAMVRGILIQHVMQAVSREAFGGANALKTTEESLAEVERSGGLAAADKQALLDMLRGVARWQGRAGETKAAAGGPFGGGLSMPFEAREEVVTAGKQVIKSAQKAHAFAGMGVQFILFAAIEAGVGLLTERQRGLWRRLRAAPLAKGLVLGARTVSGAILGLMIELVLFGFGMAAFGIRIEGSTAGFLLVAATFALMASSFGLLIAALGRSPGAARGISIFAVLLMVMLGGAWMPTFMFPAWVQNLTPLIPTRWAVDGLDGTLWRGFTLAEALRPAAALLGFTAVFGGLALARFRWDAD